MDVDISYGEQQICVNIPAECVILTPKKVKKKDEHKIIDDALQHPIGSDAFQKFIEDSKQLLVIVNDASRPSATAKILEHVYPALSTIPHVQYLVATGSHRPPTPEEYRYIFGRFSTLLKQQIFTHDARNQQNMTYLGTSKRGTEVSMNNMVLENNHILVIGSVEPHYFAGYTGGRKAFLPGVSSYRTIEMNHRFALSKEARSLNLHGNPVHEDMVDISTMIKGHTIFSIQTVMTEEQDIYAMTTGDLYRSFEAALPYANEVFCVPLARKGNIVITVAPYPMDIDLYQSQKALDNAKLAIEPGGIIILVSQCRMGVGEDVFLKLLCKARTPEAVLDVLQEEYKLGYHKAAKIAEIATYAQIWAVTDLEDDIIRKAMFTPYHDVQTAIHDAIRTIKEKGLEPRTVVMPAGSLTIPLVKEAASRKKSP
jgi:nickel-dependent lactate racemase